MGPLEPILNHSKPILGSMGSILGLLGSPRNSPDVDGDPVAMKKAEALSLFP